MSAPTSEGEVVRVELGVSSSGLAPHTLGLTMHARGATRIVVRPEVIERARNGDQDALRTLLHEAGHVVLHQAALRGERQAGDIEQQADAFADFMLALLDAVR